jgi:hypothetical protein
MLPSALMARISTAVLDRRLYQNHQTMDRGKIGSVSSLNRLDKVREMISHFIVRSPSLPLELGLLLSHDQGLLVVHHFQVLNVC